MWALMTVHDPTSPRPADVAQPSADASEAVSGAGLAQSYSADKTERAE
jgi:hypothetical protein